MLKYSFEVTEWHSTKEEYVEGRYDHLFKKKCKILAGLDPKFPLGEKPERDYYVDENGDRCKSTGPKYWYVYNNNYDDTYNYVQRWKYVDGSKDPVLDGYFYREKTKGGTPKPWIEAKGDALNSIKNKVTFTWDSGFSISGYPSNCKPLDYEVCMKWSARALALSGVEGGAKKFSMQDPVNKDKFYKYAACVLVGGNGDVNGVTFPWYSRYIGFFDEAQTETTNVDGEEKLKCKGLKDIIQLPDFKIGDNPVGSKSEYQIEDLETKKREAVSGYEDMNTRTSTQRKVESRLTNELQTYKTGAIVMGK
jgi:hypothetical protein